MTREKVGLVGAGGINESFVARMPELLKCLGPVKGSSLGVSRRITNRLRAGVAASHYAELQACGFIWIVAPESTLDQIGADLVEKIAMPGKMVVLCDVMQDSLRRNPIRMAGARIATLNCVPESEEQLFVAEGHPLVIRELKKLLAFDCRRLIELRPAKKTLYLSGIHIMEHLLTPWIIGAVESFVASGFPRSQAARLVHALGNETLRAVGSIGARAWKQAEAERFSKVLQADKETIRHADQLLVALHSVGTEHLMRLNVNGISKRPMVVRKAS